MQSWRLSFSNNPRCKKEEASNKPSVNNSCNLSSFGKSLDPGNGWPSFHPVGTMNAVQRSATGTPNDVASSRVASAYSLVWLAVLLG